MTVRSIDVDFNNLSRSMVMPFLADRYPGVSNGEQVNVLDEDGELTAMGDVVEIDGRLGLVRIDSASVHDIEHTNREA